MNVSRDIVAVLLVLLFTFTGGCNQSSAPKVVPIPSLSVEELLTNPQTYSHTMVKVSGCFYQGFESSVLNSCGNRNPAQRIWVEDAALYVESMKSLTSHPGMPDVTPTELKSPAKQKQLFTFPYDEVRNSQAWQKLASSPNQERVASEVVLMGEFETEASSPERRKFGFGHLGAYAHELILIDVISTKPTKPDQSSKAINTTLCEVVEDALQFDGKRVRFSAKFVSDGIERSVLTDFSCSRGIEPFVPDEVEHHPDIEAFDRATDTGRLGTGDRRIVGTFTGHFIVKRDSNSRLRFVLNIERIEDLKVTPVDLKPHVPR